jgi:uncharacterized membrane protein YoaK (UPF0700 family)
MSFSESHPRDAETPATTGDGDRSQVQATPQREQDSIAAAQRQLRDRLLLLLAAVAGYTDAISYVALGNIFAANMTGSTVLLGLNLAQGHVLFALRAATALAGFLVGVAVGSLIASQQASGEVWPRDVTLALAVEVSVLVIFSTLGVVLGTHDQYGVVYLLIALAACAMGIQSAAVRSLGVVDISTTYITGTWVGLLAGLARRLRAEVETLEEHRRPRLASLYPQERDARLLLIYIAAAIICGLLVSAGADIGTRVGLIPLAPALALVVVIAARGFRASEPKQNHAE